MAELLTLQDLANGHLDVKALGEAANGDENTIVTTRTGNTYPSAERAINTMFKNGGLPAEPFPTLAKMQTDGASLADGKYAMVTDDTVNNGLYIKNLGVWVKSKHDPQGYADKKLTNITTTYSKNMLNLETVRQGLTINSTSGNIMTLNGWSISDFIPVIGGEKYTISAKSRRHGIAFFQEKSNTAISGTLNLSNSNKITVTAPLSAKFMIICLDSDTITAQDVQVEKGDVATEYEPYTEIYAIKRSVLPSDVVFIDSDAFNKEYEVLVKSKNLFNEDEIIADQFLMSGINAGKITKNAEQGWSTSGFIPVESGKSYTLSGVRGRRTGISFFADKASPSNPVSYHDGFYLPYTITAPEGAKYIIFNVTEPTNTTYDNLQLEQSNSFTGYEPFYEYKGIGSDYVYTAPSEKEQGLREFEVLDANGNASLRYRLDNDLEYSFALFRKGSTVEPASFNFSVNTFDGVEPKRVGDDIAPLRIFNTTVGANHGYSLIEIASSNHGKSISDIGSVWSDGTDQFVIIDVVDNNTLRITRRTDNLSQVGTTLTHVSGATNTADINSSSKTTKQWFQPYKNKEIEVFVDGDKIDILKSGKYSFKDKVCISESYEIMAKNDIVEWLILNKGVKWEYYNADASVLYSCSYEYDKDGGCAVYSSITAYKETPFQDFMATQSMAFLESSYKVYVPKSKPVDKGGVMYNYSMGQDMSSPDIGFDFTRTHLEDGKNPIDRLLQIGSDVGYATGYLPLYDAEPTKRAENTYYYMEIRAGTKKIYPRLVVKSTPLNIGDTYSCIAYRKYFKTSASRTAKYVVRSSAADFLYLDWHKTGIDTIKLNDDLIGREFVVHEKSGNVTILSNFAANKLVVSVDSSGNYGYLVLKFIK